MKAAELQIFLDRYGQRYPKMLNVKLVSNADEELFKWFLASLLFGAPIRESSAIRTYRAFERRNVVTPKRIISMGLDGLVAILDEGRYARYDFKTANKLLEASHNLLDIYSGSLTKLCQKATDSCDLENRLKELAKGIGDATVSIFLRELRGTWEKANPEPTNLVVLGAKKLEIVDRNFTAKQTLEQLQSFWQSHSTKGQNFADFETALFRYGKECRQRGKCPSLD